MSKPFWRGVAEAERARDERERADQQTCAKAPRVDLERLREAAKAGLACVSMAEMAALLAVVDAARGPARYISALREALEPFGPPAERAGTCHGRVFSDHRAWEEVDRWNAQQTKAARDLAVKAAVDAAKPNPRDRARDQLADAGVAVQRQFRSDQERIAELELELGETRFIAQCVQADLARVPALVEALRAAQRRVTPVGGTVHDILTEALAEWEKP